MCLMSFFVFRRVMPLNNTADKPQTSEPPKKRKPRTARSYAVSFFIKVAVTALAVWGLLTWVAGIYVCHDNSAYPMIKDGDLCITYRLGRLEQGNEVVYKAGGTVKFGRIIAFEGDTVDILNGRLQVNGNEINEEAIYVTEKDGAEIKFPYKVRENCVFVMNDHRNEVSDSRVHGGIPLEDIQGKVIIVMRRRGI